MKCEEAQELITALVDEELSHLERASIEAHLEYCPRCRWAYEQEQALKREIHKVGVISVPAELKRKILTDSGILPEDLGSSHWWNKMVLPFHPFLRPAFSSLPPSSFWSRPPSHCCPTHDLSHAAA